MNSVVADLIPSGERNLYLARLDGCMNAAYIVGPALGGILGSVNNRFPLYVISFRLLSSSYCLGLYVLLYLHLPWSLLGLHWENRILILLLPSRKPICPWIFLVGCWEWK